MSPQPSVGWKHSLICPPGRVLNGLNRLLHLPLLAPLLSALYWAALSLLAPLAALFLLCAGAVGAWRDALSKQAKPTDRARLAVLITGCDSGFGRSLASELSGRGYTVFAGCIGPSARGKEGEACSDEGLQECKLDVTSDADVDSAVERVRHWVDAVPGRRLLAVVNNAGVGAGGMCDWITMQDYERDVAVNYIGVVRVCKAFLPLLRRSSLEAQNRSGAAPRIVVVASMSGKLPVPMLSSYAASKHAVAAFAACLRMEISSLWGIHVCTALPSFHTTPLTQSGEKVIKQTWERLPSHTKSLYGDECATSCFDIVKSMMSDFAWEPARVTEGLARVVSSVNPPPSELVIGGDALYGLMVLRHLPADLLEKIIWWSVMWQLHMPCRAQSGVGKEK
ncbi:MAG: hypothetical protein SGPRY_014620, partial [Prymnesium sp.]